jgi:hypothetical protein
MEWRLVHSPVTQGSGYIKVIKPTLEALVAAVGVAHLADLQVQVPVAVVAARLVDHPVHAPIAIVTVVVLDTGLVTSTAHQEVVLL